MTTLILQQSPVAPLEVFGLAPQTVQGMSAHEIARLPVMHGNEKRMLGDFFRIENAEVPEILWKGDLRLVKNISEGMTQGKVIVHGNVGMHLGAAMTGGEIHVYGDAGDWAGAEMRGGKIHIHGNAGHGLGGAYRGSRRGMNRGLIIVEGNAGNEIGSAMRRGLIVVTGNVGDFAGAFMTAGTILVFGRLGMRAGAGLLRGSIVTFQSAELLPTYRYDCKYQPGFFNLILQSLRREGISISEEYFDCNFHRYSGDCTRLGKGEILVYDQC
jgi:formylmethanofuran dehydrogenase subunit C